MNVLHKDQSVLYICPICQHGIRWPKNFPSHYQKVHHLDYEEGLAMIKSLDTKIVENKGKQFNFKSKILLKLSIFRIFELDKPGNDRHY